MVVESLNYHRGGEGQPSLRAEQLDANGHVDPLAAPRAPIRKLPEYEPPSQANGLEDGQQDGPAPAGLLRATAFQVALDLSWAKEHRPAHPEGKLRPADASAARTILAATVEVLDGRRPAAQVSHYFSPFVFAALQTRAREFSRAPQGFRLRSVHASQPAKGVIEACATVKRGKRFQALAARLEANGEGWLCNLLRLV